MHYSRTPEQQETSKRTVGTRAVSARHFNVVSVYDCMFRVRSIESAAFHVLTTSCDVLCIMLVSVVYCGAIFRVYLPRALVRFCQLLVIISIRIESELSV